jgi:cytochrome c2
MTGTTPFKALFGIAIVSPDPQPNWNQAFTRTFWSYFQGAWLFIPPFCLIPMNRSKKRLSAGVMMTWDLKSGLSTRHIKMFKGVVIVVFVVSIVILSSLNRLFDMNARFVQSSQVPVTLVADSGNLSNATLVQQGQAIFERQCTACHTAGKNKLIGPGLAGLYGSKVELVDGSKVTADDNYIRESIENPNAKITKGFPPAMTPFKGLINDQDMGALIAYIRSLK